MSIVYCHECDKRIDTDYDVDHFGEHQDEIQEESTSMEEKLERLRII